MLIPRLDSLDEERAEIEAHRKALEKNGPVVTADKPRAKLQELGAAVKSPDGPRLIFEPFVRSVYLRDDKVLISFNIRDVNSEYSEALNEKIEIDELLSQEKSSSISILGKERTF